MNIQNAIKQLALAGSEMYLTVCTVDSVDEKARTIDCTPINEGAQILGANLQGNQEQEIGMVSFPAVGSDVVVGFINPAVAVVVLTTELTKTVVTIGNTEATVEDNSVVLKTQKGTVTLTANDLKLNIDGTTLEFEKGLSTWNGGSETTATPLSCKHSSTDAKRELIRLSPLSKRGLRLRKMAARAIRKQ